ncbi:MAG: vitamin B12-dependent ribonucleotide reductase [Syntrophus sp. (in: bacteria)]
MEKQDMIVPRLSPNALTVLQNRYLKKDLEGRLTENAADMFRRVAFAIAETEKKFDPNADTSVLADSFYSIMARLEFLPNTPTLMNAGRELGQLSACFVLPVGDSMEEIFDAVKYSALIHKSGGGTGFSFSNLRPQNDIVQSTAGISSGPKSFMRIFNVATETVKAGGGRRGANMGLLRVDHPDIIDFIQCKSDQTELTNFNISVGLTDAFITAVEMDELYPLINPRNGKMTKTLKAREVMELIEKHAWENGDPGVVFLDRINRDNPTPHIGMIESTNPCGEQPLLPYESCNLGSINLGLMLKDGQVNWERMKEVVHLAVHFLDNVVELNRFPLPQIAQMTHANRKIGLGVMGWADMLIAMGTAYDSDEAIALGEKVMKFISDEGHEASRQLAKHRGPFPNFNGSIYDQRGGGFIRNATVTTIAPTGTISIIANAMSGIEPIYAISYERHVMDGKTLTELHPQFERLAKERGFYCEKLMKRISESVSIQEIKEIPDDIRKIFVTAHDISLEGHIRMQAAFQKYTDNAVSKTVNLPNKATVDDVKAVFRLAYQLGCKGVTIYRDGSRNRQVLSAVKNSSEPATIESPSIRKRPVSINGTTYREKTGCGPIYVTINKDEHGFFEVFTNMGKAGGCAASQSEALGRMVSLAWRSGVQPKQVVRQLQDISCHSPAGFGDNRVLSCADAVARAIRIHMSANGNKDKIEKNPLQMGGCPECGGRLVSESGCPLCRSCGYNKC